MPTRRTATLLLLALAPTGAPSLTRAAPASVLVLAQAEPSYPAFQEEMIGVRAALTDAPAGVTYYLEHLESFRFREPGFKDRMSEWLRQKYRGVPVDLILAQGIEAVRFVQENRASWPGVPVVFFGVPVPFETVPPVAGMTGATFTPDIAGNVRLARRLLPGTRSVALITGASPFELRGCESLARAIRKAGDVAVLELCALPMSELLQRVTALPPDSVALFLSMVVDGKGASFVSAEVAGNLARIANRPLFALGSPALYQGVVGGVVVDYGRVGRAGGEVALRVLRGEEPDAIPTVSANSNRMVLDARQLALWRIPRSRVPAEAEILFDEPTVWQRYRQWILGGTAALIAQAVVILGLLVERRRRREALKAAVRAKELQDQVAHLNRVASLGELASSIAHELGQPLAAITNNAHATLALLDRGGAPAADIREGVSDISSDAERAGNVLARMRSFLRRDATDRRPVSLATVANDVARLIRGTARQRGVTVKVENAPDLPTVLGDEVQLLQVALNLATNALEASGSSTGERTVVIRTALRGNEVELGVEDTGPAIPISVSAKMFEPFFTTKPGGLGMGLAISRTIVEAHQGRIWRDMSLGGGAQIRFSIPVTPTRQG
jgi:signal transduction histidine kinase